MVVDWLCRGRAGGATTQLALVYVGTVLAGRRRDAGGLRAEAALVGWLDAGLGETARSWWWSTGPRLDAQRCSGWELGRDGEQGGVGWVRRAGGWRWGDGARWRAGGRRWVVPGGAGWWVGGWWLEGWTASLALESKGKREREDGPHLLIYPGAAGELAGAR